MKTQISNYWLGLMLLLVSFSPLLLSAEVPPRADRDEWLLLGTQDINRRIDRDVIYVRSRSQTFTTLRLTTNRPNVNLLRCTVYFRDGGEPQEVNLRRDRRGGESHVIDLPGRGRYIHKVVVWGSDRDSRDSRRYDNDGIIELWGRSDFSYYDRRDRRDRRRYDDGRRYDRNDYDRDRRYYEEEYYRRDREDRRRDRDNCPSGWGN